MSAQMADRKLSVKKVQALSGLSRTTIYDILKDRHPPSVDTQAGLARAFRVEPDWYDRLLVGEEPIPLQASPDVVSHLEDRVQVLEVILVELVSAATGSVGSEHRDARAGIVERRASVAALLRLDEAVLAQVDELRSELARRALDDPSGGFERPPSVRQR